ncbi:MAG: Cache 3/Cache 2 fusion domain-containing protein [Proteobacteria bacterium]|nr:Cache 3/Cache 2 fusion domain-containing protein [Pseudomonadota bacterium]MBU1388265.1 Cache 3/Cache 2 fusion domain-containing protein [Pseudomonadota bacterium]MBU1541846.1 Cache 3/Cache 2 fusion domain-containing protein [Pseudomonadota bacterium]MBU2481519.1 Cache 3/Cache 2 fusion domain-containing protein [Pseudomonadota bacterium]
MKKRSLKFKLIVGGILAVLLPLTVVGLFAINKASTALIAAAKGQALHIAGNLTAMIDVAIEQEIKLATEMALEPLIEDAAQKVFENGQESSMDDLKALDSFLVKVYKQIGSGYDLMFVTDSTGTTIADSTGGSFRESRMSVADRDYFNAARAGRISTGIPSLSRASGKPIFVVAIPLKTPSNQFAGIFATVVQLDTLSDKITKIKVGKTGYPFMMDKAGLTIAHPNKEFILQLNLGKLEGMESITDAMMAQKSGVEEYTFNGINKIAGFAPVPATGWSIGVTQDEAEFMAPVVSIRNVILISTGIFLAITLLGVLWFARGITLPINRIIDGLNEGSNQVAAASSQVSSSSQSLAEGASEQAASIEETSSSMEEMSSMTKKNAENAAHADGLMKEANLVVTEANASMEKLTVSMADISKASEDTSKIIKTIDEIAFQTNLLALNAAVEAARAGEAGAGFAVVADEVRNLAMRAAQAAKNTAELIEGTVKKINDGSQLVSMTNEAFKKVSESSAKVGSLVSEISEASKEQSSGIEQVNLAISEMDKVVQQNAANAEESASASEEMNAQAEQLKSYVGDLVEIITGNDESTSERMMTKNIKHRTQSLSAKRMPSKHTLPSRKNEIRPEQLIPFDDDDFKDF